jgi:MFS family permease
MLAPNRGLPFVLVGYGLLRIASGATTLLVGLYLAELARRGLAVSAALAGALGAVAFGAELAGAIPMGLIADAIAPRALMTAGAVLGSIGVQLFGIAGSTGVFFLSRGMEGFGASATAPALLAHLTGATEGNPPLRARVMTFFEMALLAGLAFGGLAGGELWRRLGPNAFAAVSAGYFLSAGLLYWGAVGSRGHGIETALAGFVRALRQPSLRRLAPIWLCVNSLIGLWLGPALSFLLTGQPFGGQYLAGLFSDAPHQVGWVLFGYSIVFGVGLFIWSFVLPRIEVLPALRVSLMAMLGACAGLYALNRFGAGSAEIRWMLVAITGVFVMVESGFTPAALTLLAGTLGSQTGRGAAMGIYSVLLNLGALVGSVLAGWLGGLYSVNGLLYGTLAMAVLALLLVRWLEGAGNQRRTNHS